MSHTTIISHQKVVNFPPRMRGRHPLKSPPRFSGHFSDTLPISRRLAATHVQYLARVGEWFDTVFLASNRTEGRGYLDRPGRCRITVFSCNATASAHACLSTPLEDSGAAGILPSIGTLSTS